MRNAKRPFNNAWNADERASLASAEASLTDAVVRMMCADPMCQSAEERQSVVAYIKAMADEIRRVGPMNGTS